MPESQESSTPELPAEAQGLVDELQLKPLPEEGGYFRRHYKSLSDGVERAHASAIYFLITPSQPSKMHRIDADEHFIPLCGDPAEQLILEPNGSARWLRYEPGTPAARCGHVPANLWQGCRCRPGGSHGYTLFSVFVVPAFDWLGFEMGPRKTLARAWPEWKDAIKELT